MTATVIDGKASAAKLREKIAAYTAELKAKHGIQPGDSQPGPGQHVRHPGRIPRPIGQLNV